MAIEAISRGASRAVLVDREPRPAEGNIRHLEITDRCEVVRSETVPWLESQQEGAVFDLVFLDPPHRMWPELGDQVAPLLIGILTPGGRVVVESGPGKAPGLPGFETVRERRYGRTLVTFHALPG